MKSPNENKLNEKLSEDVFSFPLTKYLSHLIVILYFRAALIQGH